VVVRCDGGRAGKSGVLTRWLPEVMRREPEADAVAVVDADNLCERGLAADAAEAIRRGAVVCQARLRTLNGGAGFWPGAIGAAYEWSHWGSQVARQGWGCTVLGGTGMIFSRELLERVPFEAVTLTDDLEYTMRLRLAGLRPWILRTAVLDEKPLGFRWVFRQRWRWMTGHIACAGMFTVPLLRRGALDSLWFLWSPFLMSLGLVWSAVGLVSEPGAILGSVAVGSGLLGLAWLRSRVSGGLVPAWWGILASWVYSWVWVPAVLAALVWPATTWVRTAHVGGGGA